MFRIPMKQRGTVLSFTLFIIFLILTVYLFNQNPTFNGCPHSVLVRHDNILDYIQQRNNLSRLLNLKQQLVGQMECERNTANRFAISATGGWCAKISVEVGGRHRTDRNLIPALADLFKGKTVASFGDGPGRYKQLLLETGKLQSYDAYDGAPFSETTSDGMVKFLDLTLPQYGLPVYDWIISLEVVEHIPQQYESIVIDNIVRHAQTGIVLSWGRPGQQGYSHVNNRPVEYVKDKFESLGFKHNEADSQKLKENATLIWLKTNINVYRRVHLDEGKDLIKRLRNA